MLLTTFVNVLPSVWSALLERFAAGRGTAIETRTVDSLAMRIVAAGDGPVRILTDDERAQAPRGRVIRHTPACDEALGGTPSSAPSSRPCSPAGGSTRSRTTCASSAPAAAPRSSAARARGRLVGLWERYRDTLRRAGRTDWPLLRLRALELAQAGSGPRYDAIIVDEAQDLTEAQVRLLMALDARRRPPRR